MAFVLDAMESMIDYFWEGLYLQQCLNFESSNDAEYFNPDDTKREKANETRLLSWRQEKPHMQMNDDFNLHYHQIPNLEPTYVHRDEIERKIAIWITSDSPSCLCIRGHKGAGKTSLSVCMAWEAKRLGFEVFWISGRSHRMTPNQLKSIDKELLNSECKALFFIDDIQDKKALNIFRNSHPVIVTSNDFEFERDFNGFDIEIIPLGSLTNQETENLLINILNSGCKQFQKNDSLWLFVDLCSSYDNQPLFISILGTIILDDYEKWSSDFSKTVEYISELCTLLNESKNIILEAKCIDAYCEQECNTCSIILMSIQRLSSYYGEMFRRLVLHDRDESIFLVAVTILWDVHKRVAYKFLDKFCRRHLLMQVGFNSRLHQYEYKMHELVFDVLRDWVGKQGKFVIANQAVRFYVTHAKNVNKYDETYYRRFVSWCVAADQIDVAVKMVCDPHYLASRTRLGYSAGLLSDLELLSNSPESPVSAISLRDAVLECLRENKDNAQIAERLLSLPSLKPTGDADT